MGIRTTMAGLIYRADHNATATKNARNVVSLAAEAQLQCIELSRTLALLVADMTNGDPNIATVNAQISALQ